MATVQKAVTFVSCYTIYSELHVIWSMYLILINSLSLLKIFVFMDESKTKLLEQFNIYTRKLVVHERLQARILPVKKCKKNS